MKDAGVVDKRGRLRELCRGSGATLELGCGSRKRIEHAIGVDAIDALDVDVIGDIDDVLRRIPDESVGCIVAHHVLEHVRDVGATLTEIARICSHDARIHIVVPHFANPYFASDPTHRTPFGLYTFAYFASRSPFRRQLPSYARIVGLEILSISLGFKSSRPWYVRHAIKSMLGFLASSSIYFMEFWEENLLYIFPPYEIRVILTRR